MEMCPHCLERLRFAVLHRAHNPLNAVLAGPIWSYPPTFLHGVAKAPGISFLNVFTAVGGFSGESSGPFRGVCCPGRCLAMDCSWPVEWFATARWTAANQVCCNAAGPYIIGSLSQRTGSYASSMYTFAAFNAAAAVMLLCKSALGPLSSVLCSPQRALPAVLASQAHVWMPVCSHEPWRLR